MGSWEQVTVEQWDPGYIAEDSLYSTRSYLMEWMLATSASSTNDGCKDRGDTGLPKKT